MKSLFFLSILFFCSCSSPEVQQAVSSVSETPKKTVPPTMDSTIVSTSSAKSDFSLNYVMGKFDPSKHLDFVELSTKHASKKGMYLRKDTYEAFKKMSDAAQKEGISMVIRSATRPFNHQKQIWEGKWTGQRLVDGKNLSKTTKDPTERALKILEYSSMPSTSRHHWGTDFDINAFENSYFEKGEGKKLYDWMLQYAASYGFCQPYTPKGEERPHGYFEEKWHWSYHPIAKILTQQAKEQLNDDMIKGFEGAETASKIQVVQKYILGINKACFE